MFRPSTLFAGSVLAALTMGFAAIPANAQTQTTTQAVSRTANGAGACRQVQVTGDKIAIRDFPFVNGLVVRTVARGTILTTCGVVAGNGSNSYPSKCGLRGQSWYQVRSGRLTVTGSPYGYVPATCVRVI
ncbi:hypothetical protein ACNF49_02730 [Actinomadura sp. ATCC 39365]